MKLATYSLLLGGGFGAGLFAYACGSNDSEFADGAGNGSDGGNKFGDPFDGGGSNADGSTLPTEDTCGGKPCANYTGPKDLYDEARVGTDG